MQGFKSYSWAIFGVLFALLWSSASTATKFGLAVAQPLSIALARFSLAAGLMLIYAHFIKKHRLPKAKEWLQLSVYALLNITIYLGLYVVAMKDVTAGVGALAVATNPVFISFLSVFFLKHKLNRHIVIALLLGSLGVLCAAWPLLGHGDMSSKGLLILLLSMLSYSAGVIYFAQKQWNDLSLLVINGWQTLLGGIFLSPFVIYYYHSAENLFNTQFWVSVSWLAILVSIAAVQFWLILLRINAVKAGMWLFLCPVFGFIIAAIFTKEPLSLHTLFGVILVFCALYLSKQKTKVE